MEQSLKQKWNESLSEQTQQFTHVLTALKDGVSVNKSEEIINKQLLRSSVDVAIKLHTILRSRLENRYLQF